MTIQKVDSELYKQTYRSIANRVCDEYLRPVRPMATRIGGAITVTTVLILLSRYV
ncbi:hypothetical protein OKW38_000551 [Paraburkholderia sp. MM5496-R1]|uniref:hypothetical protein n=1 Tax=unclassified Paraburkholderia TaxID=2615204 RepID=UPI003D1AC442